MVGKYVCSMKKKMCLRRMKVMNSRLYQPDKQRRGFWTCQLDNMVLDAGQSSSSSLNWEPISFWTHSKGSNTNCLATLWNNALSICDLLSQVTSTCGLWPEIYFCFIWGLRRSNYPRKSSESKDYSDKDEKQNKYDTTHLHVTVLFSVADTRDSFFVQFWEVNYFLYQFVNRNLGPFSVNWSY